ncbi:putative integral membrane protein (TIGR00698 family) [Arcanobacterium pluranimalium]|uniref:putative sulfate exporter family transporter n=1 Tax=Arcanobacterium pluranimalium TaxID=108028 RepID=UPI0019586DC1|nr:putative integral membrane protein (TIGR00698 family) [Arcanobacterium pluranimalium]
MTTRLRHTTEHFRQYVPGFAVSTAAAIAAVAINSAVPTLSALLLAIIFGVIARNTNLLRSGMEAGLAVVSKRWLRIGIVLLGFQLVLTDIAKLGWGVLGTVVCVVALGIVTSVLLGRMMGVSPTLALLIGCGFSICGAAAVAGMDGSIDADERDVATAVALVVLFGTAMIFVAPALVLGVGMDARTAGVWEGAAIHEVAQVVAAAGITGGGIVKTAVVVKLARVLMLAPVITLVTLFATLLGVHPAASPARTIVEPRVVEPPVADRAFSTARLNCPTAMLTKRPPLVPLFVLGFIGAAVIATSGIVPAQGLAAIKVVQTFLLAAAMFGLGCGVKIVELRKVGVKPLVLGLVVSVVVAMVAYVGAILS